MTCGLLARAVRQAIWKEPMVKIRRTQVLGVLLLASLCLLYLLLRYWQSR